MKKSSAFGINMSRYIRSHEDHVKKLLELPDCEWQMVLEDHLRKLAWLQHERLIHLLVTILFALLLMFIYAIMLATAVSVMTVALLVMVVIILAAYVIHYFRLENSVQRWYLLADNIREKMSSPK